MPIEWLPPCTQQTWGKSYVDCDPVDYSTNSEARAIMNRTSLKIDFAARDPDSCVRFGLLAKPRQASSRARYRHKQAPSCRGHGHRGFHRHWPTRTTTTKSAGEYAITNLPPTTYNLTIDHAGFQKYTRQVQVGVGSRERSFGASSA